MRNSSGQLLTLSIWLFLCIFLLNNTTKLIVCSFLFVLSALAMNFIVEFYVKKQVIGVLIASILVNVILVWYNINLMLLSSFFSVLISFCLGVYLLNKLKSVLTFQARSFIFLFTCSLVDTSIVTISLINKFTLNKVLMIGFKDIIFKLSYVLLISCCMSLVRYLLQQKNTRNYQVFA